MSVKLTHYRLTRVGSVPEAAVLVAVSFLGEERNGGPSQSGSPLRVIQHRVPGMGYAATAFAYSPKESRGSIR